MLHPRDFFDLTDEIVADLFIDCAYVWQALARIGQHIARLVGEEQTLLGDVMPGAYLSDRPIFVAKGARIEPGAYVLGPAYIGAGVVVRHGAYIRKNVILLDDCTLGHASEVKNSILLPESHAPHFNYVGDSILGYRVNLGAGTKLSNLSMVSWRDPVTGRRPNIEIEIDGIAYDTGLEQLGSILGDDAHTGCNSVLNPGCLIGPSTLIYPNLSLRKGYHPGNSIIKMHQETERVPLRR